MEIRPHRKIIRKKTKRIMVGKVPVGDGSVISVQSTFGKMVTNISGIVCKKLCML